MRRYEVAKVVGTGSAQELICQTITLPQPAEEIKEIRKTVIIDNCRVIFDKVIIDGRLRKDIAFKTATAGFPIPGTVQGCAGVTPPGGIFGPLVDLDVDLLFNMLIPVPGAKPGDTCVVLEAFVEGEKEEAANITAAGAFTALIDKSVVFVCVKVVRDVVTSSLCGDDDESGSGYDASGDYSGHMEHGGKKGHHPGHKGRCKEPLCKPRKTTGFHPGEKVPAPQPGPLPGTWIGPTLVFQGVLNPGIPTLFPTLNTITAPGGTQIEIADQGRRV